MKKLFVSLIILVLLGSGAYFLARYLGISNQPILDQVIVDERVMEEKATAIVSEVDYEVVEVARNLFVPWSLAFSSENRILVAERNGYIKEIVDGELNTTPLYFFDDVATGDEEGLMGMALHPDYSRNNYIYACYAYSENGQLRDRVVRLIDNKSSIDFDQVILNDIPAARFHAGCRIKFGPDGYLYITTGDATDKKLPQDLKSLAGKIIKISDDGEEVEIFSAGHRNPQGIDWDIDGNLYSSEHGPSGFDGPGGGDELNLIEEGGNYGWPLVSHDNTLDGTIAPLIQWTPAIAPGSLLVYKSDLLPQFTGDIFIGGLKGEGVYRVIVSGNKVGKWEKLITGYGRIREVISAPNGEVYFTTSNKDGRGELQEGDDKIFKLTPVN